MPGHTAKPYGIFLQYGSKHVANIGMNCFSWKYTPYGLEIYFCLLMLIPLTLALEMVLLTPM